MVGNGTVSRLIERQATASPLLVHRQPGASIPLISRKKVAHTPGKTVDTYLKTSKFFKGYVSKKMKGGLLSKGIKAENAVTIHKAAAFKKKWVAYAIVRTNPDTGKQFTKSEAEAWESTVNAFQDSSDHTIHIHEERGEPGTGIHESMHLFASSKWSGLGFNASEGATEFFTKKLCGEQSIVRGTFYPSQCDSVTKLVAKVTEKDLAGAYFKGQTKAFEKKVNKATKDGTWDKWVTAMQQGKYDVANALVA